MKIHNEIIFSLSLVGLILSGDSENILIKIIFLVTLFMSLRRSKNGKN